MITRLTAGWPTGFPGSSFALRVQAEKLPFQTERPKNDILWIPMLVTFD